MGMCDCAIRETKDSSELGEQRGTAGGGSDSPARRAVGRDAARSSDRLNSTRRATRSSGLDEQLGEIGQGSAGGLGALSGHAKGYMIAI